MSHRTEEYLQQSDRRVWISLVGGIAVWALHLMIVYPLTSLTCRWGWFSSTIAGMAGLHFVQMVVTVIAALLMIILGISAMREWRRNRSDEESMLQETASARRPLMAFVAMVLNGFFLLAILLSFVPIFAIEPCV